MQEASWTLTRRGEELMFGKWFWNIYAICYDSIARLTPYQEMLSDIIAALDLKPGMKIFDAGCGTGNLEQAICMLNIPVDIDAVDFSCAMLKRARKKNKCPRY